MTKTPGIFVLILSLPGVSALCNLMISLKTSMTALSTIVRIMPSLVVLNMNDLWYL